MAAHLRGEKTALFSTTRKCGSAAANGTKYESCALSCLAPGCKWCVSRLDGIDNPTALQQSRCNDCECRGCWMCRSRRVRDHSRVGQCAAPNTLMLLVHGQAFRQGSRLSTATTDSPAAVDAQLRALRSLHQMVLEPAVRVGWAVEVLIDVSAPAAAASSLEVEARRLLGGWLNTVRVQPLLANQMRTVLANLEFALNTARVRPAAWRALLLVRVDVEWKRMVALPLPAELGQASVRQ